LSITYGFYNSVNGDRRYDATQISSIFDGIVTDGIFMSIGDALRVKASTGMEVSVGIGRAWFNHTWTLNDAELLLELAASDALYDRIDCVVLEVNTTEAVRANDIKIITGVAASEPKTPELTNTTIVHQYKLADIYVKAGTVGIVQANITNHVGKEDTPYITGILKTVNTDDLIAQWESEWDEYVRSQEREASEWTKNFENDLILWRTTFDSWSDTQKANFANWFSSIKTILSDDVGGNLQNEIDLLMYPESSTTVLNDDGSIVTTTATVKITSTMNDDGSVKEVYEYSNGVKKSVTITFNGNKIITNVE
jgi:hypothetical protein